MTPEQFAEEFTRALVGAMSRPLTAQSWRELEPVKFKGRRISPFLRQLPKWRGWKTIRELYPLQLVGEHQSSHYTFCAWEAHGKAERRRRDGCVYEWRLL